MSEVESPYRSRTELEQAQLLQLRSLIASMRDNTFWSQRLEDAVLSGSGPIEPLELQRIPLLGKEELARDQETLPPHGTNLSFDLQHYVRLHRTSSTTGTPLSWLDTEEDWAWMRRGWERVLRAAGVGASDRALFAFSFGPFIGFWLGFEAAQQLGALVLPGGAMDSIARLELMRQNRVTVLGCTPTYALRLGEVARERGLSPEDLPVRVIVVAGEPGGCVPAVRRRLAELWPGARVLDHYGMTEVGPVSYQLPAEPDRVVLNEEHYLCEFVEPESGEPIEPDGERLAELVLTPLGRRGMPVLRYRTGDLVQPDPRPGDGSFQTLRGGIRTRSSQMVVVRGVNLYPGAFEQVLRNLGGIAEYQVTLDLRSSMAEASVEVELEEGARGSHLARIEEALKEAFHLRIPVHEAPTGLPRFELKARRWNVLERAGV